MRKEKYVYNEQSLQYEKVEFNLKASIKRVLVLFALILICSSGLLFMVQKYIPSPKEITMEKELNNVKYNYSNMITDFDLLADDLEQLQKKDSDINRLIFGMEPMDNAIWEGGTGGHDNSKFLSKINSSSDLIETATGKVEKLKYKIKLQKESLDTIYKMAIAKEKRLASIPSIKPVSADKCKRNVRYMSGFGIRLHPVHKVKKLHKGIDFTAPRGTDIQATGNGKVVRVERRRNGYGKNVIIDHGYGYTSLYAHMSKISVKLGDKVTKGQVIGKIGNSGTSTASHLHYEVRINNKAVNPIDYCLDGLSNDEYQELVNLSSMQNQSLD